VKKGQPGPKNARVHMTRTKKMIFDTKGLIHMNYIPKGKTASAKYVNKALARFLKVFKENRLIMSSQDWFL
jgi:hypothetical protein